MTKLKKRVGAWVVMDVVEKCPATPNLIRIIGPIVQSNFLQEVETSDMPVMAEPFDDIPVGTRVKLIFTTTLDQLEAYKERKAIGFEDYGYMYLKATECGWEKFYDG